MESKYISVIANSLEIQENQVKNTIKLLKEGATIPFISRYRKEMTGSLDEIQLTEIQKQLNRIERKPK